MTSDLKTLIKAAQAGGKVISRYFGKSIEVTTKTSEADVQTKADLESEAAILKIIEKNFPSYSIFSEETGTIDKNSRHLIVVDPLDGTFNFTLGIPYFSVSIALMDGEETILGVIHNPITGATYSAAKGKGAYLDGVKLKVSNEHELRRTTIAGMFGWKIIYGKLELAEQVLFRLYHLGVKRVMRNWSPALDFCLLASGKIEAIVAMEHHEMHDFVAGKLIAREAGAKITDLKGRPQDDRFGNFIASNGTEIHKELVGALKKIE